MNSPPAGTLRESVEIPVSVDAPERSTFAPVAVTKYDKPFVVVMAVEEYERLMEQVLASRKTGETVPSSKGTKRIGRI